MKSHHKNLLFIFFITLIILLIAFFIKTAHTPTNTRSAQNQLSLTTGTALPQPRALPNFSLVDSNNKLFSNKQLNNNWSFLFFGYTQCEGICPATLGKLSEMATLLGPASMAQFVFISIDPQHDTVKQLKTYFSDSRFKNANFLGATGNHADIQSLAKTIGLFISQDNIPINGHIEHSGTVLLINPDGKLAAIFSSPNNPPAMARDFRTLMHQYHQGQS